MDQPTELERITLLAESWDDRQKMFADIKEAVDAFNDTHGEPFSGLWEEEAAVRRCHTVGAAIRVVNAKTGHELIAPQPFFSVNGSRSMDECRAAVSSLAASVAIESQADIAPREVVPPPQVNRTGDRVFSLRQVEAVVAAVREIGGTEFPKNKQILDKITVPLDKSLLADIKAIVKQITHPESD
ncbi:hypothetical protein [Fuerstiella marisgermanici]|uniref:Uncharacterized protein n=1 Tax=Fuerstiella marisgermanici TaxID=1891926 RepID=A0A1P8WB81_9PLAN|nr:hypothetical protein [Fuerstiella marisgermanici]APZ91312.1 hypothetical protein Fuma_00900 [Fuerstiella marisgermanici]